MRQTSAYQIPAIEWDGSISEIRLDEVSQQHVRHTLKDTDQLRNPHRYLEDDLVKFDTDVFELISLQYDLDEKRTVQLQVYVHDAFCKKVYGEQRTKMITEHVDNHSAWFFSYGTRLYKIDPRG